MPGRKRSTERSDAELGHGAGTSSSATGSRSQKAHPRLACDLTCSPPGRAHHAATLTRSPKWRQVKQPPRSSGSMGPIVTAASERKQ